MGGGKSGGSQQSYQPPPAPVTPDEPSQSELDALEKARQSEAAELAAKRQLAGGQDLLGGTQDELKTKRPTLLGGGVSSQ